MTIFPETKNHNYCRIPPRINERGNKQGIQANKGLKV